MTYVDYFKRRMSEFLHPLAQISSLHKYQSDENVSDDVRSAADRTNIMQHPFSIAGINFFRDLNIVMIMLSIVVVVLVIRRERLALIWAFSLASFAEAIENNGVENKKNVIRLITLDVLLREGIVDNFEILDLMPESEFLMTLIIVGMSMEILGLDIATYHPPIASYPINRENSYGFCRAWSAITLLGWFSSIPVLVAVDVMFSGRAILIAFIIAETIAEFSDSDIPISLSITLLASAWVIRLLKLHFYFRYARLAVHNSFWVPGSPGQPKSEGSELDRDLIDVLHCIPVTTEEFILQASSAEEESEQVETNLWQSYKDRRIFKSISTRLFLPHHEITSASTDSNVAQRVFQREVRIEKSDIHGTGLRDIKFTRSAIIAALARNLEMTSQPPPHEMEGGPIGHKS